MARSIGMTKILPSPISAGASRLLDRLHDVVGAVVADPDLDPHLGQETHDVFRAAIDLRVALLAAVALDLGRRHAVDADPIQRVAHGVELERLDDCGDELHRSSLRRRVADRGKPPARAGATPAADAPQSASSPVSPVRTRSARSIGSTKIFPSPIWPVRAAARIASIDAVDLVVGRRHLESHLRHERGSVFRAAVDFGMAFLPAVAVRLAHRHAAHGELVERGPNLFQLERFDDRENEFHGGPPSRREKKINCFAMTRRAGFARAESPHLRTDCWKVVAGPGLEPGTYGL